MAQRDCPKGRRREFGSRGSEVQRCLITLQKRIIRIIARLNYFDHTHESFVDLSIIEI